MASEAEIHMRKNWENIRTLKQAKILSANPRQLKYGKAAYVKKGKKMNNGLKKQNGRAIWFWFWFGGGEERRRGVGGQREKGTKVDGRRANGKKKPWEMRWGAN